MFGTIQHYRPDKGFGFIRSADHLADLFFHVTEFHGSPELLRVGAKVEFNLGERKGKRIARDVRLLEEACAILSGGAA